MRPRQVIFVAVVLVWVSSAFAIDRQPVPPETEQSEPATDDKWSDFSPHTEFSFGGQYRMDSRQALNHAPMFELRIRQYVRPYLAFVVGAGYNHWTEYKAADSLEGETVYDFNAILGLRLQPSDRFFAPYLESGLDFHYYAAARGVAKDARFGLSLAGGIRLQLRNWLAIDAGIRHTLNRFARNDVVAIPYLLPGNVVTPPGSSRTDRVGIVNGGFSDALFNPTAWEIAFSVKL